MADQDHEGEAGEIRGAGDAPGQVGDVPAPSSQPVVPPLDLPGQSPLFHAEQADRYDRQRLITLYQEMFGCRLVVVVDNIFPYAVTLFEELIYDADPSQDLHLLLNTPGGDGETAVRLARAAQSRCREFTVIVPDIAKSAGTILALGAHHIIMGPVSDLGPIDPQFQLADGSLVGAKDIIAAVDDASAKIQAAPDTYPLHASLLSDVTGLMVQQARAALARTDDLLIEALRTNPDRAADDVKDLSQALHKPLIEQPQSHGAIFGAAEAIAAGLPVVVADPATPQWQLIWRLWAKYFTLFQRVYEGERASKMIPWQQQ
jgi:Serine dehydrogenase proteinase